MVSTIASSILIVMILATLSNEYLGSVEFMTSAKGLWATTVIRSFCDHVTAMTVSIPKAPSMATLKNLVLDGGISAVELDN